MRIAPLLVAAALAAGCASSHTRIDTGPAVRGAPVPGTAYAGGRVAVEYPSSSAAPGLVILTALGLWLYGETAAEAPPDEVFAARRQVPAMDPARRVNEQDCTKPIEAPGANLRCR